MSPSSRRRKLLRIAAFLALQAVLLVAVLEVGLRLLAPQHGGVRALLYRAAAGSDYESVETLPELLASSMLGHRPLETHHGYVLNSRSFRTPEYTRRKAAGILRVLAIGDSFTYGVVPDAMHFTTLFEAGLEARRGHDSEVLRLGVPGTGTPFQLRLWQLEGSRLDADLVVLGFFVGNDFVDELGTAPGFGGFVDRAATASYTVRLVKNGLRLLRHGHGGGLRDSPISAAVTSGETGGYELPGFRESFDEDAPTMSAELYHEIEAERLEICLRSKSLEFRLRFDRVAQLLERFAWEVRQSGADFLVMIIPDEFQVDPEVLTAAFEAGGHAPEDVDLDRPQRALRDFFVDHEIPHVDLLPSFRDAARDRRLYLEKDSHWNAAGNRLAAERLLEAVSALRKMP